MERPKLLVRFERLYLAAFAVKLILLVLNWATTDPGKAQIGIIASLLLWFGIMHRHSNGARWLAVGFSVVSTIWCIGNVFIGEYDLVERLLLTTIAVLNVSALLQLIKADVEPWFARGALPS